MKVMLILQNYISDNQNQKIQHISVNIKRNFVSKLNINLIRTKINKNIIKEIKI